MSREERFINFFSQLTPDNLSQIDNIFATDAHFKDPFNDVSGIVAIHKIFSHMFSTTDNPRFVIKSFAINNNKLFLQWDFSFEKNSQPWNIDGCSVVSFNKQNEVQEHIDYWDPAEQIYSKISFLKPFMNFLKNRLKAS